MQNSSTKCTWQTWVQNAYTFIVGWVFLTLILELVLTNLMWRAIFPQEQGEVLYKSGRSGDISRTNTVWGLFRRRRWRKCISIIDGGSGYSLKMSLWRGVDGDSQFPYQERWGIGGNDWKLGGLFILNVKYSYIAWSILVEKEEIGHTYTVSVQ